MYTDELEFDDKTVSSRTYLKHPGSVANLVIDDNNNVLLINKLISLGSTVTITKQGLVNKEE